MYRLIIPSTSIKVITVLSQFQTTMKNVKSMIESYGGKIINYRRRGATWAITRDLGRDVGRHLCAIFEFDIDPAKIPSLQSEVRRYMEDDQLVIKNAEELQKIFQPVYERPVNPQYIALKDTVEEEEEIIPVQYASEEIFNLIRPRIVQKQTGLLFSEEPYPNRPFDVFISCCEKGTARDLAADIHRTLEVLGYKVFHPAEHLRNCEWPFERYLWAMDHAKMMIVVGSEPSHFDEQIVVADEYRRFWHNNHGHIIRPLYVYVDIDPLNLPDDDMLDGRAPDFLLNLVTHVRSVQIYDKRKEISVVPPYWEEGKYLEMLESVEYLSRFHSVVNEFLDMLFTEDSYFKYEKTINTIDMVFEEFDGEDEEILRLKTAAGRLLREQLNIKDEFNANQERKDRLKKLEPARNKYSLLNTQYDLYFLKHRNTLSKLADPNLRHRERKQLEAELESIKNRVSQLSDESSALKEQYKDVSFDSLEDEYRHLEIDIEECEKALRGELGISIARITG